MFIDVYFNESAGGTSHAPMLAATGPLAASAMGAAKISLPWAGVGRIVLFDVSLM